MRAHLRIARFTRLVVTLAAVGSLTITTSGCLVNETYIIDRTNATRAGVGSAPLEPNLTLWLKAGGWSIKMADDGKLSHSVLADGNPLAWKRLAENVGAAPTLDQVYQLFLDSGLHERSIKDPGFNYIGVGVHERNGVYWVTQEFMQL